MEIKEFQEKLSETLGLAVKNGKKIHADTVKEFLEAMGCQKDRCRRCTNIWLYREFR